MINSQKFTPDWESLKHYKVPDWFRDTKFGIFIHWGVYSVPAYGSEWYPRLMYMDDVVYDPHGKQTDEKTNIYEHHVSNWGHPSQFGYKDFVPMFKGKKFDAAEWLDLFERCGAKYVVPVAEHHDAFAMYNSSHTRWNSVNMGPKRDILRELKIESSKRNIYFGASSHLAFNWNYFDHKANFDTTDPQYADMYARAHDFYAPCDDEFLKYWWKRTLEIIDTYQPDIFWFDFYLDRPEFVPYHTQLATYYYNKAIEWGRDVVLQTKNFDFESYPQGTNMLDLERGKMPGITPFPWQTDTSIGENSWGYVTNWISKSAKTLIDDLVDIVSKNGCLLLNVGPKADGTIPDDQIQVLNEIGCWLKINGEAIYGTRPWTIFGEGPTEVEMGHHSEGKNKPLTNKDIRFTQKGDSLYAIIMDRPDSRVLINALGTDAGYYKKGINNITVLGLDTPLSWQQNQQALTVDLPNSIEGTYAFALKIT